MTTSSSRYPELVVSGSPREMGQQLGEAAGEEIRGFVEVALGSVQKTVRISRPRAMEIVQQSLVLAQQYDDQVVEELRGISETTGITLEDLMLLQVRNQLRDEPEGACTSFSVAAGITREGRALVGQNWDNNPELDPFTMVVTRRPVDEPAMMCVTQVGLVAYIGLNDAGLGVCLNTLPAPSRDVGVPHYFTLRGLYKSRSLASAVEAIDRAQRAIPANIMLATPEGPANLEVTCEQVFVLRDSERLTHTNHCLHPELLPVNNEFPELIESGPRKNRIDRLFQQAEGSPGVAAMKRFLSDHDGYPRSICRHPNDHPEHGYWTTVFSVVVDAEAGQLHVSRGNPCETEFELYQLD
ncbi:MAG: C45 family peptidase [Pirellulaceae bacterium]